MKRIGIIGGIGPESTVDYYRGLIARSRKAGIGYPELALRSIDMEGMLAQVAAGDFTALTQRIAAAVCDLKGAGAEIAAMASNTPHIAFGPIAGAAPLPMVSIVQATADHAAAQGYHRVLLLGTRFTMEASFYPDALQSVGVHCAVPDAAGRDMVHNIIFPELEDGIVVPAKKTQMIHWLESQITHTNADAVVLGCTELPLMLRPGDASVPLIDTVEVHMDALFAAALEE